LNISLDAALGCRANVFHILKPSPASGVKKQGASSSITIHSQAAPIICRHTLDVLISLAKSFPSHFLPRPPLAGIEDKKDKEAENKKGTPVAASALKKQETGTDFWDLLARLDSQSASRKGKGLARTHSGATTHGAASAATGAEEEIRHISLESSPFGQLLALLSSSVVRRSSLLTDRLLRLLSLISLGLYSAIFISFFPILTSVNMNYQLIVSFPKVYQTVTRSLQLSNNSFINSNSNNVVILRVFACAIGKDANCTVL
jgi:E3 ubiquitin-protein ligase HUWE1